MQDRNKWNFCWWSKYYQYYNAYVTSGSLWNFKRDEIKEDDDLTINNVFSFKYKANLIGNIAADEKKKT